MLCRVVFPNVRSFAGLGDFLSAVKELVAGPAGGCGARFFLFGEDILWAARSKGPLPSHEQVLSFIPRMQRILHPNDFVIFSIYETIGPGICNSVYLIGRKEWHFDFKRVPAEGDLAVCGLDITHWPPTSKLNAKRHLCVRSGEVCIRNLYLLVCADITQLHRFRPPKNALIFIPAGVMPKGEVGHLYGLKSSGWVFINDPAQAVFWHIGLKKPLDKKELKPIPFEGSGAVSFEFDFSP